MKASEMILVLQEMINEHGDLPLFTNDDGRDYEVKRLEYNKAQEKSSWNPKPLPEHIEVI